MPQARFVGQLPSPLELVFIVIHADDRGSGDACNFTQGPADTATQIRHPHSGPQGKPLCEVALVARKRIRKTLVRGTRRKMKTIAPTVLIEVCHEIVVFVGQILVCRLPLFQAARLVTTVNAFVAARSGCHGVALERVSQYVGEFRGHGDKAVFVKTQNEPHRLRRSGRGRQARRRPSPAAHTRRSVLDTLWLFSVAGGRATIGARGAPVHGYLTGRPSA